MPSELIGLARITTATIVSGTEDDDYLSGTTGSDTIKGLGGDDYLSGCEAGDSGPDLGDRISGGAGDDRLSGNKGFDRLYGNIGNDWLFGGIGADRLSGGAGSDTLMGGEGNDVLIGGAGRDFAEYDFTYWGAGVGFSAATLDPKTTVAIWDGVNGTDTLTGIEAVRVNGSAYADSLTGSRGGDWIYADYGNDTVIGGSGNDSLAGEAGSDVVIGDNGNDTLIGGEGNDTLYGGQGIDRAEFQLGYGASFDAQYVGTQGAVTLGDGSGGTDSLRSIEGVVVRGSSGNDNVTGSAGDDALYCDSGDIVRGLGGNDTLYGGTMTGGEDADHFVFRSWALGGSVTDFLSGQDRVELVGFEVLGPTGQLNSAFFEQGTGVDETSDRLVYDQATGKLYFDADGSGTDSGTNVVAEFGAGTALSATDIWVV